MSSRLRSSLRPGNVLVVALLMLLLAVVIAPAEFTPFDPEHGDVAERLLPPDLVHPFGTDQLGRDVLARVIHGTSATLLAGLLATAVAFVGGVLLGLVGGSAGRFIGGLVMRFSDVILAIPAILLVLLIVSSAGRDTLLVALGVGIAGMPRFVRLTRVETLRARSLDFVAAGRMAGSRPARVAAAHILPTVLPVASSIVIVEFAQSVLTIAALTFIGLGTPGPAPELGLIVSEGRDLLTTAWWISILPASAIMAIVLVFSAVGRSVRSRRAVGVRA